MKKNGRRKWSKEKKRKEKKNPGRLVCGYWKWQSAGTRASGMGQLKNMGAGRRCGVGGKKKMEQKMGGNGEAGHVRVFG